MKTYTPLEQSVRKRTLPIYASKELKPLIQSLDNLINEIGRGRECPLSLRPARNQLENLVEKLEKVDDEINWQI